MVNIKVRLDNDDHYVGGNNIKYIVIHDTGNTTDSDEGNANYFCTGSRGASAHYFVDSDSITQIVKDTDCSWHCGDGNGRYGITNRNSIGIELCRVNNKVEYQTKLNAIELIRSLMAKYNVPIDRVVRHYDASRKICPSSMSANNWAEWYEFKNMITGHVSAPNQPTPSGTLYRVRNASNDIKSQVGAFRNLESAKNLANEKGLCVWDGNTLVYSATTRPKTNTPSFNPHLRDLQSAYNHDYGRSIYVDGIRGQQVEAMLNEICLSVGSRGQCVGWLQIRIGASVDDIFGNETKQKVMNFQRQHGLVVDGIVGRNTLNKLLELFHG